MKQPARQKGIALLMLLIIIVLAIAAYLMSGLSPTEIRVDREAKTLQALNKAKEALIAYAVNYPEGHARGPGFLPCPDTDNDGDEQAGCNGAVDTVGRLPWKRLSVGDIRDSSNERLWYAVSVNYDFTNNPERPSPPYPVNTPKAINTTSIGNITVRDRNNNIVYDGTTIDAAVAVIIAPGGILKRDDGVVQDRSAANENNPVNYLDVDTASGEDNASFQQTTLDGFINGEIVNAAGEVIVNDRVMVITYDDIMEQLHKRVSREISNVINSYFSACDAYPEAADFNPNVGGTFDSVAARKGGLLPVGAATPFNWNTPDPNCDTSGIQFPPWFTNEDWHLYTYYEFAYTNSVAMPPAVGIACTPGPAGDCLKTNGLENIAALIVFAGRDTTGARPSILSSDYFEGENDDSNVTLDGLIYDAGQTEDYVHVIAP